MKKSSSSIQRNFDRLCVKRTKNVGEKALEQVCTRTKAAKINSIMGCNTISVYNRSVCSDAFGFHDISIAAIAQCDDKKVYIGFDSNQRCILAFQVEPCGRLKCLTMDVNQCVLQNIINAKELQSVFCPVSNVGFIKQSSKVDATLYEAYA